MAIIYKCRAQIQNTDIYVKMNYQRIRKDIANLLKRIDNGDSLKKVFANEMVAASVKGYLIDASLLTETEKVSHKGKLFINSPYFDEEEEGVFSIDVVSFALGRYEVSFILKATRKLEEDKRDENDVLLGNLSFGNSFQLENEKCIIKTIQCKSKKSFSGVAKNVELQIDSASGTYLIDNIKGHLGEEVIKTLQIVLKEEIAQRCPEFTYDEEQKNLFINSLKDINEQEIASGVLNRDYGIFAFQSEPFVIKGMAMAKEFAYNYAYCLLDSGKFLSTDDLNDIFINEILSGKNICEETKDKLLSFKYSLDDFEKELSKEKFEKLDYRIKITNELLNVDVIKSSDKSFASLNSYDEVTNYLVNKRNPSEVDELFLIMGYAFVNNKKNPNRIIDCLESLQKEYRDVTIVDKAPTSANVSYDVLNQVKEMGINVIHRPSISDYFHDRYILFKLKDGTYDVFMCSSDIGQLFGNDGHVRGNIIRQKIQDVTMKGRNLIEITMGR